MTSTSSNTSNMSTTHLQPNLTPADATVQQTTVATTPNVDMTNVGGATPLVENTPDNTTVKTGFDTEAQGFTVPTKYIQDNQAWFGNNNRVFTSNENGDERALGEVLKDQALLTNSFKLSIKRDMANAKNNREANAGIETLSANYTNYKFERCVVNGKIQVMRTPIDENGNKIGIAELVDNAGTVINSTPKNIHVSLT